MAESPEKTETRATPAAANPREERRPYSGGGRGPSSRGPSRDGRPRRDPRDGGPSRRPRRFHRGKVCFFCVQKVNYVDYKSLEILRRFITDRGKILPRRITGTCARHQRALTSAIKRSRNIALIPFKAR